jgi:AraC-like DNA-binding protein
MGTSYTKLVAETRIRLATKWIRKGKRSLPDIAQALGYNDPSNFSRAFRRVAGLSPRAFRNSLAQEQQ